LFSLV